MAGPACRTSGVLSASAVVSSEKAKLISVHLSLIVGHADNIGLVQIYDSGTATTSGKTEIVRFNLVNADRTAGDTYVFEADMHGVIAIEGLYCVITNVSPGGNTTATVATSIEFA
jgi:hypothetical protein